MHAELRTLTHNYANAPVCVCVYVREEDLLRRKWSVSGGVREMATQFA